MHADEAVLADVNRFAYDQLAGEYEQRTADRVSPTSVVADRVAALAPSGPVIDVGCGVGLLVKLLRDRGVPAIGIDFSEEMVGFARSRNGDATVLHGDFMRHPFDEQFAGVVSMGVLHLFPSEEAARMLGRMRDLLLPDGVLYVTTTREDEAREGYVPKDVYTGGYLRYRRFWTESDFARLLCDAGFDILERLYVTDDDDRVWMNFVARRSAPAG